MVYGVSRRVVLPPDRYVASLARKRMAVAALFRDEAGDVLLVNPVYKPKWDLPGGADVGFETQRKFIRSALVRDGVALDMDAVVKVLLDIAG
jgi:hypothetical protein